MSGRASDHRPPDHRRGYARRSRRATAAILRRRADGGQGFFDAGQASDPCRPLVLKATARNGDDFVLPGSKLWRALAQYATHHVLLARLRPESKGGDDWSFLLVEMDRPGIAVRRSALSTGEDETKKFFFERRPHASPRPTDAAEIGKGWKRQAADWRSATVKTNDDGCSDARLGRAGAPWARRGG